MSSSEPLPDDVPFCVQELDKRRAVVRFAEYVDHRRTPELDQQLFDTMRQYQKLACDVRESREIDSDWLTLLADVTVEARQSGKRVALVGLNEALRQSADVLGLESLELVDGLDEVWG